MKVFKEPNISNNWKCPICGTNDVKEVVLISIYGTEKDNICEARQYHLDCIELQEVNAVYDRVLIMQYKIREK